MSIKKLFITGATGWIGGSVLEDILKHFGSSIQVTALLRSPRPEFISRYPQVKIVQGTFDDFEIIEKATIENGDIVIHTGDIDHEHCARAILSGLRKRTTPSFAIHLTGTGCISDHNDPTWLGKYNPHAWHDIAEAEDIYNLPDEAFHHRIDRWFMDIGNDNPLVKSAIVCPPDIYGQSSSSGTRSTFLVPLYVECLMRGVPPFYLGAGENIRAVTHLQDVVDLFVLLVDQALQGGGNATWGKDGFYFAVSDSIQWKDAASAISQIGQKQGWLPKSTDSATLTTSSSSNAISPISWTREQVAALNPQRPGLFLYLWGSNSRAESARARKLGWKPHAPSFWEELERDCLVASQNFGK